MGGTPIYKLYRYVPHFRVWFSSHFMLLLPFNWMYITYYYIYGSLGSLVFAVLALLVNTRTEPHSNLHHNRIHAALANPVTTANNLHGIIKRQMADNTSPFLRNWRQELVLIATTELRHLVLREQRVAQLHVRCIYSSLMTNASAPLAAYLSTERVQSLFWSN